MLNTLQRQHDFITGTVSHTERMASTAGGCVSSYAILLVSNHYPGAPGALLSVPSTGAVLLFAVAHGPLSQPRHVCGGHIVSALIGVWCFQHLAGTFVATAPAAVTGDPTTYELGYPYMLAPVLLNATVIALVAVLFNHPFARRRYPGNSGVTTHYGFARWIRYEIERKGKYRPRVD
jgi:CBS-domain-containing membrane protein